jgi:hypothetical protein
VRIPKRFCRLQGMMPTPSPVFETGELCKGSQSLASKGRT